MARMRLAPAPSIFERAGFGEPQCLFIAEVSGAEAPARSFGGEVYRLAAVALLIHANVDGQTGLAERRRLKTIIEDLDAKAASELITMGEQSGEAVDFYYFTSVLKRPLDDDVFRKIVEIQLDIAFTD